METTLRGCVNYEKASPDLTETFRSLITISRGEGGRTEEGRTFAAAAAAAAAAHRKQHSTLWRPKKKNERTFIAGRGTAGDAFQF